MAAKRKHRSTNEYLKYLRGELSSEERYSFERDLEADAFDREAMEGMEKLSASEVEEDLLSVHASLGSRLKRRRRRTFYYVAASVASLLIVGTVFLNIYEFNPRNATESIPADESFLHEGQEIEPKKIVGDESMEDAEVAGGIAAEEQAPQKDEGEVSVEAEYVEKVVTERAEEMAEAPAPVTAKEVRIAEEEIVDQEEIVDEDLEFDKAMKADEMVVMEAEPKRSQKKGRAREAAAPVSYATEQEDEYVSERIGGIVLSSEDMEPLPGASIVVKGSDSGLVTDLNGRFSLAADRQDQTTIIASYVGMETNEFQLSGGTENQLLLQPDLSALNEVVVIGYDADKSKFATGAVQTVNLKQEELTYSGAEPEGGLQAFKMYIEEQIRFPAGDSLSNKEVVVLKFHVERDGSISDIQTLRSPGLQFTEEATRLLKEGPSWNPAKNDTGVTEDVVRMRIVFKQ